MWEIEAKGELAANLKRIVVSWAESFSTSLPVLPRPEHLSLSSTFPTTIYSCWKCKLFKPIFAVSARARYLW